MFVFSFFASAAEKPAPMALINCDTVPTGVPQLFGGPFYQFAKYLLADSMLMMKPGDTNAIPRYPALKFKSSDNRWYAHNRSRWQKLLYPSDTISLSDRINRKVNISDTAAMLAPYINFAGWGIVKTGQAVRADTSATGLATKNDLVGFTHIITENKIFYRGEQYLNHVVDDDGTIDVDTSVNITDFLPINGNESMTISSTTGENITIYGWVYDTLLNPIAEIRNAALIGTQLATYTFTAPANARYINVYTKITNQDFYRLLSIKSTNTITYAAPVRPETFSGANATEKIQRALNFARFTSSHVELTGYYKLDSALFMSSGNTLVLNNAHVQMNVGMHDNMIRNEAVASPYPNSFPRGNMDIKILGVGNALFEGSYENWGGGDEGWHSWGIVMANVERFEISGFTMKATQANAIDLVQSRVGNVKNIVFIEGLEQPNQGGVEVIRASNRITIDNIMGTCMDDMVTIGNLPYTDSFHLEGPNLLAPYAKNFDVHDVIVTNIHREISPLFFLSPEPFWTGGIRLLSTDSFVVRDCTIDGVTGFQNIYLQDPNPHYGVSTVDLMYNITVTNTSAPIWISAPVSYCSFLNIAKYDSSGTYQSAVPPDSSLNITRKYYNESLEYNAFVGVRNWVIQADQFETNGIDIERNVNVAAAAHVTITNINAGGHANFVAKNDGAQSFINGISGSTITPFAGIQPNTAYVFSNATSGMLLTQVNAGSKINFVNNSIEQMRIMETGVGIGETVPSEALHISNFNGSANQGTSIRLQQNSDNTKWSNISMYKSRGSAGSPTAVADGDILGTLRAFAYDGTSYIASAGIIYSADGTPSTGLTPGKIGLFTRDGSGSFNENLRVTASGHTLIGTTTDGAERFQVAGSVALDLGSDATGDVYYRNSGGTFTRLGIGSSDQVLTVAGGLPTWQNRTSYSKYIALITQSGAGNPTSSALDNSLSGAIVWTRNSAGNYTGTLTGAFTSDKTWITIQASDASSNIRTVQCLRADNNTITLLTYDAAGAAIDGFTNVSIEVRVYP